MDTLMLLPATLDTVKPKQGAVKYLINTGPAYVLDTPQIYHSNTSIRFFIPSKKTAATTGKQYKLPILKKKERDIATNLE
jgi:hypothetical protein